MTGPTADTTSAAITPAAAITSDAMLAHWQAHRRLTRRVIDAFPEEQLFSFALGGMRPFGKLALEMIGMSAPMVRGAVTDDWRPYAGGEASSKAEVLKQWDETTEQLNTWWPQIPAERFQQTMTAFGQYEGPLYDLLLYVIDNEIHHRGQGYVYLRALGISPPEFYDRS